MFDETQLGWLGGDDYEVAAGIRVQAQAEADPDRPDHADTEPSRDLLGELLAGHYVDDGPPTAPR